MDDKSIAVATVVAAVDQARSRKSAGFTPEPVPVVTPSTETQSTSTTVLMSTTREQVVHSLKKYNPVVLPFTSIIYLFPFFLSSQPHSSRPPSRLTILSLINIDHFTFEIVVISAYPHIRPHNHL